MEHPEVVMSLCLSAMTFKARASEMAGVGWDVSHLLKSLTTRVLFRGLQEGKRTDACGLPWKLHKRPSPRNK